MTTTLYVLDVEDFRPLAKAASRNAHVSIVKRGPYFEVSATGPFEIARDDTGCRNAVWFSSIAAIAGGRVARWDRDTMRIEPLPQSGGDRGD